MQYKYKCVILFLQGTCEKQTEDLIERIWEIIEQITPDTLG